MNQLMNQSIATVHLQCFTMYLQCTCSATYNGTTVKLQSTCNQLAINLQSNCNQTAINLQSTCNQTTINLQSNCNGTAIEVIHDVVVNYLLIDSFFKVWKS